MIWLQQEEEKEAGEEGEEEEGEEQQLRQPQLLQQVQPTSHQRVRLCQRHLHQLQLTQGQALWRQKQEQPPLGQPSQGL